MSFVDVSLRYDNMLDIENSFSKVMQNQQGERLVHNVVSGMSQIE